jgi:outer membrane protein OmpA-like peptidoglycan-associated protein
MNVIRIFSPWILATIALTFAAAPTAAQMYPGQDVTVNPNAIPLSQPSQNYPGFVLRPPWAHRHHRHKVAPKVVAAATPPDTSDQSLMTTEAPAPAATPPAATPPPAAAPPAHPKHQAAKPAAADTSASSDLVPFNFGDDPTMAAAPTKVASAPAPKSSRSGKNDSPDAGLAKRGAIIFEHDATDPQASQLNQIKLLAGDLNSAIEAGATQVQLQAFGGAPGDKSSEAKRISLRRALAIRQLLIDGGVPSSRIVTRAMGGATDSGEPDRVDVYVRAS